MTRTPPGSAPDTSLLRHDRRVGRLRLVVTGGADMSDNGSDGPRARLAAALGVAPERLLLPRQVHAATVLTVDGLTDDGTATVTLGASGGTDAASGWADGPPEADGLLVRGPGTAVGVLAADCMPLLLGDPERGLAAAVHVGRRGLHLGIAEVAVTRLVAAGATRLLAVVGPTVCGRCYEVPQELHDEVVADVPAATARTRAGTPSLDIPAGVRAQLHAAAARTGVPVEVDESWAGCTIEDPTSFSHRRDAPTGRHAAVVVVEPA